MIGNQAPETLEDIADKHRANFSEALLHQDISTTLSVSTLSAATQ